MPRQALQATFVEAEQHARKLAKAARWPKAFSKSVFIMHGDGTTLYFTHAFARRWRGFVIVVSEHNGVHVAVGMDLLLFEVFSNRTKLRLAVVEAIKKTHNLYIASDEDHPGHRRCEGTCDVRVASLHDVGYAAVAANR
jgi:hypothetical protein